MGGLLGIGAKSVAIPWQQVTPQSDGKAVVVAMGKEELQSAPEWKKPVEETIPPGREPATAPNGTTAGSGWTVNAIPSRHYVRGGRSRSSARRQPTPFPCWPFTELVPHAGERCYQEIGRLAAKQPKNVLGAKARMPLRAAQPP